MLADEKVLYEVFVGRPVSHRIDEKDPVVQREHEFVETCTSYCFCLAGQFLQRTLWMTTGMLPLLAQCVAGNSASKEGAAVARIRTLGEMGARAETKGAWWQSLVQ